MKLGVVFPPHLQPSPDTIRKFVQAIENMGYDYILTYEELVDAKSEMGSVGWLEPYTILSFAAALTDKLEFATGISVLPVHHTVIVAKQIAMLDHLCGGRLRYGVSVGWNKIEYRAVGVDFTTRGKRLDEQIMLLRELWTKENISIKSDFHHLTDVAILPLPIQQPIPIWVGGFSESTLKRVVKLGDGWIAADRKLDDIRTKHARLQEHIAASDRDPADIGFEIVDMDLNKPENWREWVDAAYELNTGYMAVTTRYCGFDTVEQHIERFQQFIEAASEMMTHQ